MQDPDLDNASRFDAIYAGTPPWDIGKPQPAMLDLLNEFPPSGRAVDVGCGTGELTLELARRGLSVIGVDSSQAAIALARAKAAAAPDRIKQLVEFRVGDALDLSALTGPFGTVVDSGFYHLFGPGERSKFTKRLSATLEAGGRYYMLGFAFDSAVPGAPRAVTEDELRSTFDAEHGWQLLAVRPAKFAVRSPRGNEAPAIAACVERAGPAKS